MKGLQEEHLATFDSRRSSATHSCLIRLLFCLIKIIVKLNKILKFFKIVVTVDSSKSLKEREIPNFKNPFWRSANSGNKSYLKYSKMSALSLNVNKHILPNGFFHTLMYSRLVNIIMQVSKFQPEFNSLQFLQSYCL